MALSVDLLDDALNLFGSFRRHEKGAVPAQHLLEAPLKEVDGPGVPGQNLVLEVGHEDRVGGLIHDRGGDLLVLERLLDQARVAQVARDLHEAAFALGIEGLGPHASEDDAAGQQGRVGRQAQEGGGLPGASGHGACHDPFVGEGERQ